MAQPPSFYGQGAPRIGRLPMPSGGNELSGALSDVARSVNQTIAQREQSQDQIADMDLQTRRIERERELTQRTGEGAAFLADAYGTLQADLLTMRQSAGPGALGHEEKVNERIGKFRDDVMGHLGNDPELVARLADNVATFAASSRVGEMQFAAKERAAYAVANVTKLPESLGKSLYTSAIAGEELGEKMTSARQLLETTVRSQPIPASAQDELIEKGKQGLWLDAWQGRIEYDPGSVVQAIDKGALNNTELTSEQVKALRQRAQVEYDQRLSKAKSAAGETDKVERAKASVLIEQVNSATLVDTAALQTHLARAEASQDPEDIRQAHDLRVAIARNEVTAKYDSATNQERTAAIHQIEGTKDWTKNEQLVAAHDQLSRLIGRDATDAKQDPLELFARQTGATLGDANLGDRASMSARFALGDRAGQRYDRPPTHLTDAEATQLREQWNNGNPLAKANLVQQMGSYGPKRGRELMRQLAPNKPQFARLVELSAFRDPMLKGYVTEALDGWAQPPMRDGIQRQQNSDAQRILGDAWAKMPGDRRNAILTVAQGIYSHRAAQAGNDGYNSTLWRESLNAALGGANGKGGVGARNGGSFILPTGTSQDQFDLIMSRAGPADFRASSNGVPRWGGRDMTEGEFKRLTPVLVNDTGTQAIYAFRSASGGFAKTASGDDYVIDYRRLLDVRRARLGVR